MIITPKISGKIRVKRLEEEEAFRLSRFEPLGDLGDLGDFRRGASLRDLDLDLSWVTESSGVMIFVILISSDYSDYSDRWDDRGKFRSQTSDNMDIYGQMKSRDGKSQREEKSRREKIREEKESEERSSDARKGRKVAKHSVFPMVCGSGGSKSRLSKAVGAEPSGQMRDEKVHTVVARSTFRSQNVQSTPFSDHFWKLRCRKSARRCGAKHISKSKCAKQHDCAAFGHSDVVSRGRRKGLCTLSKVSKTWGFCGISKKDGRCGTFEEDLQRCIFRRRRSTRDIFIRAVRRSGRWFPERGCILEHQIFRFAEMWFCVTGAALRMTWHHCFVAGSVV